MYYKARRRKEKKETTPFSIAVFSVSGLVVGFILFSFLFTALRIHEDTMEPGIRRGSVVVLFRPNKGVRGSRVVLKHPFARDSLMLRRIAAVENDTIEIIDKIMLVNSQPWNIGSPKHTDSRIFPPNFTGRDNMSKIAIPSDSVFVVGDNRDETFDSRSFGPVHKKNIIGTVIWVFGR